MATSLTNTGVTFPDATNQTTAATGGSSAPVGMTYIQYPGMSDPATLHGGTWSRIFDSEGVFFRTEGGNASAFTAGIQEDAMQPITGNKYVSIGYSAAIFGSADGVFTPSSTNYVTSERDTALTGRFRNINFNSALQTRTATEARGRNRTIRVWVKTS